MTPISTVTAPSRPLRVLFVTSQFPTEEEPSRAPFVGQEVAALRRAGIELDVFHYRGGWSILPYMRTIRRFRRAIRQTPYDLVHVRFGQCGVVALSQRDIPIVLHCGGTDLLGWRDLDGQEPLASRLLRFVSHQVARRAAAVLVDAEVMARRLQEGSYRVIPSGVDLDRFQPRSREDARAELGLSPSKRLVLFAANPRNVIKRHSVARDAVALLPRHLDAELLVATGVPHDLMPVYMNAADALVLTSEHEGSPNVVKEALACDLPVVSVDVGDVRERIGDLDACEICRDPSPRSVAAALQRVLQRDEAPMLRSAVLDLHVDRIAARVISVYREVLDRRRAAE